MICIRLICILIILASSISAVSGDVRIYHNYFTEGGEVSETVNLHNVDYANSVSIYQDSLFAAADSVIGDEDEIVLFKNNVLTRGEGKLFGTNIKAGAEKEFGHHLSLSAGSYVTDKTSVSYNLESGITEADYFTDGGRVHEGVIVDNVYYANQANMLSGHLSCSANANLVDGVGLLMDDILVDSREGLFGTKLMTAASEQLSLEKEFTTGSRADPSSLVSYAFEFGETNADYFNRLTDVNEYVLTDSCVYQGYIKNSVEEMQSRGHGRTTEDDSGGFVHNVEMNYNGMPCEISAALSTGEDIYGSRPDIPARYVWDSLVESDESHATSTIGAKGYNGNRDIYFAIEGKSQGLTDKIAGPTHISPIGFIGISKELYISYEITI